MKTLYCIRHAKSSWEFDLEDHKRPLNQRGIKDANLIAHKLKTIIKSIDIVKSSHAERAKQTAKIVLEHLDFPDEILTLEPNLYDFSGQQVIEVIKNTDSTVDTLMIFGHNHAFTSIVNRYGSTMIVNLPTAGVVVIQFDVLKWEDINVGKTLLTIFPKELR